MLLSAFGTIRTKRKNNEKFVAVFEKTMLLLFFKIRIIHINFTETAYIFKTLYMTLIKKLNVQNNFYSKKKCLSSKM